MSDRYKPENIKRVVEAREHLVAAVDKLSKDGAINRDDLHEAHTLVQKASCLLLHVELYLAGYSEPKKGE